MAHWELLQDWKFKDNTIKMASSPGKPYMLLTGLMKKGRDLVIAALVLRRPAVPWISMSLWEEEM